ncbi:MAG: TlpA disulfide reductase family protein [Planctomycetota bacterium]
MNDPNETESPRPAGNRLGIILLLGMVVIVLALRFSSRGRDGVAHPLVGRPLGHLALEPLSAGLPPLDTQSLQGKVTLINFWGTWCGPCQIELPHLIQLERQFRNNPDFQFVSVTVPLQPGTPRLELQRLTADRLNQLGADFGFYEDARGESMTHLNMLSPTGTLGIPTTLVVDRTGTIRGMWVGYASGSERQMETVVRDALAT